MTAPETVIIGAGPAGLAFAACHEGPTRIVEQDREVGGLCRSIAFGGAVFDLGGHSFHTPHPDVARLIDAVMPGRMETQRRDARIAFGGGLIDYPFQQHLDQIADAAIAAECRDTLPATPGAGADAEDFENWIERRFGTGVARHFMRPYNRKLWACDLGGMSCEWVSERIAGSQAAAEAERRTPLHRDSLIAYPAEGGFGEIFRALARRAGPIDLGERVTFVDPVEKILRTDTGRPYRWNRLVSTMPLPTLLACIAGCPDDLRAAAATLAHVSLKIVMIAATKAAGERPQRLYVPDPDIPAHKIAFNHRSSTALRARPIEAAMCEISYSPAKPAPPDGMLEREMVDWLGGRGLIGEAIEVRTIDLPFAYPVPTKGRGETAARIQAHLAGLDIFSIGRFGGWNYANSDGCMHEAMALAERLGSPAP